MSISKFLQKHYSPYKHILEKKNDWKLMLNTIKLIQGNGIIIKSQINKQGHSKENKYQVIARR